MGEPCIIMPPKPTSPETPRAKARDEVNHPAHYTSGSVECIDALAAALGTEGFRGYCRGNIIKYLWRLGAKGDPATDARKAAWYANRLVQTYDP